MKPLNGIIVPSLSFFNKNFEINLTLNSILYKHILLNGADSLFLFGGIGEGIYFHDKVKEKAKLIEVALEVTEKKNPVLCSVFGNQAGDVLNQMESLGKKFRELTFVVAPPFSKKLNGQELKSFFENIFSAFTLHNQILIYNNPSAFASNETNEDLLKSLLTQFDNLIGIKDTNLDINKTLPYIKHVTERFRVFCGEEVNYARFLQKVPLNLRKFSGLVPASSNIVNVSKRLYDKALEGKVEDMRELQGDLDDVRKKIYDDQPFSGQEQRGLKCAFYSAYKDQIPFSSSDIMNFAPEFSKSLSNDTKKRINNTIQEFNRNGHLDRI